MHNFEYHPNRPILLVEDNPMDVDLTRRAFDQYNLTQPLTVARDGQEALANLPRWEAGEAPPVLILLDLKLPKIDGLDVLHQLKKHPIFCTIPVIILSTSADEDDIQRAYQLGANSYIIKPVDFDRFIEIIAFIQEYWLQVNTLAF